MMLKLCARGSFIWLVLSSALALVRIANAQSKAEGASPQDLSAAQITAATMDQVIQLSEKTVVRTEVRGNVAFAVGSIDSNPFGLELVRDVTHAYGVHFGQLLFSRARETTAAVPVDTKPGNDLFVLDLRTKLVRSVFVEYGVVAVAWHPRMNLIAATIFRGPETSLILYDFNAGTIKTVRKA